MGQFNSMSNLGLGLDNQPAGLPRGHGRRHSVNVVNKPSPAQGSISFPYSGQDGFDDGFAPPPGFGGHSRTTSRVDSSWRISKFYTCLPAHLVFMIFQMEVLVLFKATMHSPPISLKPKRSFRVCSSFALRLVATITRCHLSRSPTCFQT
jgi:hypothetical protein